MNKLNSLFGYVAKFAKYATVFIILGQTFEFLHQKLAEKFPVDAEKIEDATANKPE